MDVKSLIQKLTGKAPEQEAPTAEETQVAIEALETKETELAAKEVELTDRETSLNQKEADLSEKESGILTKETELTEKETTLATKETDLAAKETALTEKETNLDTHIAEAAQKLSVQGTTPVKPEAKDSKSEIVATYNAMPKGAEKIAYFQKHEQTLRAAK
jgi:uncharacterized protein (DUF3084 family)